MASVSRGRLKECNQTRKLFVFFGRIALATYWYLTWKRTLQLQIFCGVWLFEKAWKISWQLVRAWDRSWNRETHDKVVRLGMSKNVCITNMEDFRGEWCSTQINTYSIDWSAVSSRTFGHTEIASVSHLAKVKSVRSFQKR